MNKLAYAFAGAAVAVPFALVAPLPGATASPNVTSPTIIYTSCVSGTGTIYNLTASPTAPKVCHLHDRRISWNQKGPVGAQGPRGSTGPVGATGAQGATGPQGPAGPAVGVTNGPNFVTPLVPAGVIKNVLTAAVSMAGTYYITASVNVQIGLNDVVHCGVQGTPYNAVATNNALVLNQTVMTVGGALTVPQGGTMTVTCVSPNGDPATMFLAGMLTAIRVDNSNGTAV
jgi:hypothetical protein